jgi:RNA-directed DNA polymerase
VKILDFENLHHAYVNARRGKSLSVSALGFRIHQEAELASIRQELDKGTSRFGSYRRFTILDPKKRNICAAPFRERVAHHAIIRVIGGDLERYQIHHSYACRLGKGTERAVLRAFSWARSSPWYLKLDVRKYYDSIDHALLFGLLQKRFKDRRLLNLLSDLIDHYIEGACYGRRYLRYMDDMLFFVPDRESAALVVRDAERFLSANLSLELKRPVSGPVTAGVPFLGFLIFPDHVCLLAANKRRFQKKGAFLRYALATEAMSEQEAGDRASALVSVRRVAKCRALANSIWYSD